jgi:hypothetical protein
LLPHMEIVAEEGGFENSSHDLAKVMEDIFETF